MRRSTAKIASWLVLLAVLIASAYGSAYAQGVDMEGLDDRVKVGQTGMQFLKVTVDPQAGAVGGAVTARKGGAIQLFHNPATTPFQEASLDATVGQLNWLSDIQYHYGAMAYRPANGQYGTIGVSVVSVNYGEVLETIRAENNKGYVDLGTFSPSSTALGLSYATMVSDRFSVGGTVKYAYQSLGASTMSLDGGQPVREANEKGAMVVDFGVLYDTGFRGLNFGVSVRNFSKELTYEVDSFELPLAFKVGLSMDMMRLVPSVSENHGFKLSVDAHNPRANYEQVVVGGEYGFMDTVFLRGGYRVPTEEEGFSLGAGLQQGYRGFQVGFDYAYQDFGVLNDVHRVGLRFAF